MKGYKYLFLLVAMFTAFVTNAQNKKHDWGLGVSGGIYSYSAILERKLTNPYEYRLGANISVSRYFNNNFDVSFQGNRSRINYPTTFLKGEPAEYEETHIYGANFSLKYKLDNGYILREHSLFAPYITFGAGASMTTLVSGLTYSAPVGLGVQINTSQNTSLVFESQYNHDFIGALSYMQHNVGLKIHIGKANKKRVLETRERTQERQYEKIQKYREEQRIAQAQKAQERLDDMNAQGLVAKMMTMEEDADLLNTGTIVLNDEQATVVSSTTSSKPKEVEIVMDSNTKPVVTETTSTVAVQTISAPPTKPRMEEIELSLEEKPNFSKPEQIKEKVSPEIVPVLDKVTLPVAPTKPKEEVVEVIKPKPTTSEVAAEQPKPIQDNNICRNKEVDLSAIGEKINFDSDRYRVRPRMYDELDEIVSILKECNQHSYVIIAHTDSDGNYEYNKDLAKKRAVAIKKYLMDRGIESSRLKVVAYGSSVPIAPNTSSNNKAKNRRIEFRLNRSSFDE